MPHTATPHEHQGIQLNAESVRAELWEAPDAHDIDTAETLDRITSLSDDAINAAIEASANDHFWEQYDAVRRSAISRLKEQLGS